MRRPAGWTLLWSGIAAPGVSPRVWMLLLSALVVMSAAATWRVRAVVAGHTVEAAAPPPLLATPIPAAQPVAGTQELRIAGSSAVWSAPALPRTEVRRVASRVALPTLSSLPHTPAGEVDRWVVRLATGQRAEMQRYLERMARYEPLIRFALAERGLPGDLLYLALIESGFSPRAVSAAGAVGIWQFMPGTARDQGLEVSTYVDERRDPVRATYAAVRHLEWLHRQFGSWHLATAAYNAGDSRVGGVLQQLTGSRGGQETLYWMIRPHLPTETQDYVPKLLAASRIARSPEQYGFDRLAPAAPLRFREVSVPGGVPLAAVAHAAGVAAEEVYELNPHLVQQITPPGRRWPVRIPVHPASGG